MEKENSYWAAAMKFIQLIIKVKPEKTGSSSKHILPCYRLWRKPSEALSCSKVITEGKVINYYFHQRVVIHFFLHSLHWSEDFLIASIMS